MVHVEWEILGIRFKNSRKKEMLFHLFFFSSCLNHWFFYFSCLSRVFFNCSHQTNAWLFSLTVINLTHVYLGTFLYWKILLISFNQSMNFFICKVLVNSRILTWKPKSPYLISSNLRDCLLCFLVLTGTYNHSHDSDSSSNLVGPTLSTYKSALWSAFICLPWRALKRFSPQKKPSYPFIDYTPLHELSYHVF
jgi:hypothetical protein